MDRMSNIRSNSASCETRRRLMEAAGEVFAEHGYHTATVRQICERAGANVAAVNYHFRDKAELYDAVLRYAHCAAEAEFANKMLPAGTPPDQKLLNHVRNLMLRVLDEGRPTWHGKLMSREMTEPTSALDGLVKDAILPKFRALYEIVEELLGPAATKDDVEQCCNSVIAQCVFYQHCKPFLLRLEPKLHYDKAGIEELADHVTKFSLLALQGYRAELERRSPAAAEPALAAEPAIVAASK